MKGREANQAAVCATHIAQTLDMLVPALVKSMSYEAAGSNDLKPQPSKT